MASSAEDLAGKCAAQAAATHGDGLVDPTARFFAHLVWSVSETGKSPAELIPGILEALPDLPAEFAAKVNDGLASGVANRDNLDFLISIDPEQASYGELTFYKGASCGIPNSLPLSVHLIVKYGNTDASTCVEQAAIANAMLGGDSCARALLVGLVLGARPGAVVPQRWSDCVRKMKVLELRFLEVISSRHLCALRAALAADSLALGVHWNYSVSGSFFIAVAHSD
jgi:ADP-ribosylglycohydrolase